jgi:uncharacterized membrane protein YjgN (DUF898 family)
MSDTDASQDDFKAAAAAGPVERISYEGRTGAVAGIALQNALFNLITIGVYRFWAKTRLRRYFWGNMVYRGERLEYTGRGLEIFLGFLIAIAILIALVFVTELAAEAVGGPLSVGAGVIQMAQSLAIVFLIFVAIFRARRYRLSRSQWRGIRGGQSGSAVTFALTALGWVIVSGLTLGLAYPVFRTRLMKYQMENTWFGSERFGFTGRAGELFGSWFIAWLLMIPTLGLTYVWYRVREFRYFASKSRLGPLSFASDLHSGRIYLIFLTNFFVWAAVTFLFVAVGYVMLTGSGTLPAPQGTEEEMTLQWMARGAQNPLLILLLLLYLVVSGLIRTLVWLQPMVAEITTSVSIAGEMDFARLAQSSQEMPGRGEGLAEALDIGSI